MPKSPQKAGKKAIFRPLKASQLAGTGAEKRAHVHFARFLLGQGWGRGKNDKKKHPP
jgi:hypothetical protein